MNALKSTANPPPPTLWAHVTSRVDALPDWLRPAVFGPLLLCARLLLPGLALIIPWTAYSFVKQGTAYLPEFLVGTSLFLLLLIASACGGLAHGLIGRRLLTIPGGRYFAGVIAVGPYFVALAKVVQYYEDGRPIMDSWDGHDWRTVIFASLIFGTVIGHALFAPDD